MSDPYGGQYVGQELLLFLEARNFHRYYLKLFGPWLRGNVLEVGGGLGALTEGLLELPLERLVVCEPDPVQARILMNKFGARAEIVTGGLRAIPSSLGPFDAILYVDVLEHIEDDAAEVAEAADRLRSGGTLVIGGPAHQCLYSPFDACIGHYRRYSQRTIEQLVSSVKTLKPLQFRYFDSAGILLALANRWLTRQRLPRRSQIRAWDALVIQVSRGLDPLFGYRLGKSFVAIACRLDR